jgi:hypothetical protein
MKKIVMPTTKMFEMSFTAELPTKWEKQWVQGFLCLPPLKVDPAGQYMNYQTLLTPYFAYVGSRNISFRPGLANSRELVEQLIHKTDGDGTEFVRFATTIGEEISKIESKRMKIFYMVRITCYYLDGQLYYNQYYTVDKLASIPSGFQNKLLVLRDSEEVPAPGKKPICRLVDKPNGNLWEYNAFVAPSEEIDDRKGARRMEFPKLNIHREQTKENDISGKGFKLNIGKNSPAVANNVSGFKLNIVGR